MIDEPVTFTEAEVSRFLDQTAERIYASMRIARVEVREGDQNGGWVRVANIVSDHQTPEGRVITIE